MVFQSRAFFPFSSTKSNPKGPNLPLRSFLNSYMTWSKKVYVGMSFSSHLLQIILHSWHIHYVRIFTVIEIFVFTKQSLSFLNNCMLSWKLSSCKLSRLARKAGFPKARYGERMRNKTQGFREKRGSGDQHHSKVKVPKLNPSQLHYTFSHAWKNMQWVTL